MKYPKEQIIEKARHKITERAQVIDNAIDIAVDFEDDEKLTHSYVVSFRREAGEEWKAFDITEISTQG
jgi:hypothetical protein